jgi:hypothetical protein
MEAEHWEAIIRILTADIKNRLACGDIDGGQKDAHTACLAGTLNDGIAILSELLAIQMAVGVYKIEH